MAKGPIVAPGGAGFTGKAPTIRHGLTPNPVTLGMAQNPYLATAQGVSQIVEHSQGGKG